jgi:uncharacterized heparinase superfamily protein
VLLFDAARIGPDYQPGHAHADTLSFELSLFGKRIFVNSGVSTYEAGILRSYQRGTAAHNAVVIDEEDSSEVWSAFRVGRRARPLYGKVWEDSYSVTILAGHDGYTRLREGCRHVRTLVLEAGALRIEDSIEGKGNHRTVLWFHFHPDVRVREIGRGVFAAEAEGKTITLAAENFAMEGRLVDTRYYPEFGKAVENRSVAFAMQGTVPLRFVTRISWTKE